MHKAFNFFFSKSTECNLKKEKYLVDCFFFLFNMIINEFILFSKMLGFISLENEMVDSYAKFCTFGVHSARQTNTMVDR